MIIIFALVLVNAVSSFPTQYMFSSNELSNSAVNQVNNYLTYFNLKRTTKENMHLLSRNSIDSLIEMQPENFEKPNVGSKRVARTAYFEMQSKQKNKRYASYLTLCHFKICNMGRKRASKYFRAFDGFDNDT